MREIEITISKDGSKVTTEAFGFIGITCSDFTRKLTESLGDIFEEEKKLEYYEQEQVNVDQKA